MEHIHSRKLTLAGVAAASLEEDDLLVVLDAGPGLRGVAGSSASSVDVSSIDVSGSAKNTKLNIYFLFIGKLSLTLK